MNFPKFVRYLGHFLKKQWFWKMGVACIKQLPRPSKIAWFSGNCNEKALLKVSFKNIDKFQSCPFSKTNFFYKKGPKRPKIYHWKSLRNSYQKWKKKFWTFRALFEKKWFWKMGNFETCQYFWMKLSGGLPHWDWLKMNV